MNVTSKLSKRQIEESNRSKCTITIADDYDDDDDDYDYDNNSGDPMMSSTTGSCNAGNTEVASKPNFSLLHQFDDIVKDADIPRFLCEHKDTLRFPEVLLFLMVEAERKALNEKKPCIEWTLNGQALLIRNKEELVAKLLPTAFSEAKFASFTRKMYRWGFRQVTGKRRKKLCQAGEKVFWHPHFQRDNKPLIANMKSTTAEGTRRALACQDMMEQVTTNQSPKQLQSDQDSTQYDNSPDRFMSYPDQAPEAMPMLMLEQLPSLEPPPIMRIPTLLRSDAAAHHLRPHLRPPRRCYYISNQATADYFRMCKSVERRVLNNRPLAHRRIISPGFSSMHTFPQPPHVPQFPGKILFVPRLTKQPMLPSSVFQSSPGRFLPENAVRSFMHEPTSMTYP